jgi:hypothetical protein
MSWLQFGLIGAVVFTVYYIQQIKIALKTNGYDVALFSGWIADYRNIKKLIQNQTDLEMKNRYQKLLTGLHLALAGVVAIPLLMVFGK